MSRTILIARPHLFIVSVMKPFLEEGGYATDKLQHIIGLSIQSGPERRAIAARMIQRHFR